MTVTLNQNTHTIVAVSTQLVQPEAGSLAAHFGGFGDGEWACLAELDGTEPEGGVQRICADRAYRTHEICTELRCAHEQDCKK